jgi:hypothetical protein
MNESNEGWAASRKAAAVKQHIKAKATRAVAIEARPCLDANFFFPNFTMQKEDFPSHQNVGTCMEY